MIYLYHKQILYCLHTVRYQENNTLTGSELDNAQTPTVTQSYQCWFCDSNSIFTSTLPSKQNFVETVSQGRSYMCGLFQVILWTPVEQIQYAFEI